MTSQLIVLRLQRAAQRLADRLDALEARLQSDEAAAWSEFRATAKALAMILPNLAPERRGTLLTTEQMAEKLGISSKSLLKRKRAGKVQPALQLARRGSTAFRWRGDEVPR